MAFQDKKFLDAEGITHLVRLLDEYPNNQVLGSVIDAIEGELEEKAEKSEIPEVPVQDVQVGGTSILDNGIANIPIAGKNINGVVKLKNETVQDAVANGGSVLLNGTLTIVGTSNENSLKGGADQAALISAAYQHKSTFYGLAKAAGDTTQSHSSNAVGTYTDEAKTAIKQMLGVQDGLKVVRLI